MKITAKIVLLTSMFSSAAIAAPFLAIGDGAELFVTGTLGIRADDNVLLSNNATSDTIFDVNPGVEITFGKNASLKGSITLVDSFANYSDNSKLNTNLFSGDFRSRYDDAKLKLNFDAGYHELNQNAPINQNKQIVPGLIRRDEFAVSSGAEIELSQISAIGVSVNFLHENYKPKGYGDSDDITVPLNFYYKWTPKTDLSFGYRYRNYETTVGKDSTDHFFNVGSRGEFSPKLTGQFAIGVNTRKIAGGGSETLLGFDSGLSYAVTPKTSLQLGASNDFGTAPQGQQQKNFSLSGSVTTVLNEQWSATVGLSNRSVDYYTRTDNYFEGTVSVVYNINAYTKLNLAYVYRNNDSDLSAANFKNNVFSVSASMRY